MKKKTEPFQFKGVNALFAAEGGTQIENPSQMLPLSKIQPSAHQPRRYFDAEKLKQLVESVQQHGILEPVLVRPLTGGLYELVAGERRYRAATEAGLQQIPVIVRLLDEHQAFEIALIENLQREDLNPFEETEGLLQLLSSRLNLPLTEVPTLLYQMMNDAKGNSNHNVVVSELGQQIAQQFTELGRLSWQSFVTHRLPLLKLPGEIQEALQQGKLAYTKAQAIARVKDPAARQALLEATIAQDLSLSQIRERIAELQTTKIDGTNPTPSLKQQVDDAYRQVKKSKAWENPKKRKRLEKLLTELQAIATEE